MTEAGAEQAAVRGERRVARSMRIAASPERVYAAITEPADLVRWECDAAQLEARAGGRFRFDWKGELYAEGDVVAAQPGLRLELSYRVPCFVQGKHPTLVAFDLLPEGSGCRLTLCHSGFDDDPLWDEYYRGHRECWDIDLEELQTLCERGAPGTVLRCEVAVEGEPAAAVERFAGAWLAAEAAGGGRERWREAAAGGAQAVFARGESEGEVRVRALAERVAGEARLVVTESFAGGPGDAEAAYGRMRERLEGLSTHPVQCGSEYNG